MYAVVLLRCADLYPLAGTQGDSADYAVLGQSLFEGDGLVVNGTPMVLFPPGYPGLVGLFQNVFPGRWAGHIVNIAAHAITLFLLFRISTAFFTGLWPWVVILLYAVNSHIIINATNGHSEAIFILTCVWMSSLVIGREDSWTTTTSVLFGSLWGISYLVRPEGLAVGAILFLLMNMKWRKSYANGTAAVVVLCFLMLITPYLVFLRVTTGIWQISGKTYANLVLGEIGSPYQTGGGVSAGRYAILRSIANDPSQALSIGEYLEDPPEKLFSRFPHNAKRLLEIIHHSIHGIGLLLAGLGFWFVTGARRRLGWVLLPILAYSMFFITHRFISIYLWALIIYMTAGFKHTFELISRRWGVSIASRMISTTVVLEVIYEIRSIVKIMVNGI